MASALRTIGFLLSLVLNVSAASFAPNPEGVSIVNSTHFPGRSISYKEVSTAVFSGNYLFHIRGADSQGDSNLRDDGRSQIL